MDEEAAVLSHEDIAAAASQVEFRPWLLNLILTVFKFIGRVIGGSWFLVTYVGMSVKYGYLTGMHDPELAVKMLPKAERMKRQAQLRRQQPSLPQ